jgi:hypothetical protein
MNGKPNNLKVFGNSSKPKGLNRIVKKVTYVQGRLIDL